MMTFVNMDSDGLVILPTHRVVHSLPGFDPAGFSRRAEEFFSVETLPEGDAADFIETLAKQQGTAFVAVTRAGALLLRSKPEAIEAALTSIAGAPAPARPDAICIPSFSTGCSAWTRKRCASRPTFAICATPARPSNRCARGEADVAFLTNPVTMEQLSEVAFAGEVMPQKSTDFFPKLLSGLAIYALE